MYRGSAGGSRWFLAHRTWKSYTAIQTTGSALICIEAARSSPRFANWDLKPRVIIWAPQVTIEHIKKLRTMCPYLDELVLDIKVAEDAEIERQKEKDKKDLELRRELQRILKNSERCARALLHQRSDGSGQGDETSISDPRWDGRRGIGNGMNRNIHDRNKILPHDFFVVHYSNNTN
jgi:hypothetical protein